MATALFVLVGPKPHVRGTMSDMLRQRPAGEPWAWEEWELTVEPLRGTATLGAGKDGAVRLGMR